MPSEKEAMGAIIARLQQRKQELLRQAQIVENDIQAMLEVQKRWLTEGGEGEDLSTTKAGTRPMPSGWVKQAIQSFIEETGKGAEGFTPSEVAAYMRNLGHQGKNLYSTSYESLKRMTAQGKLEHRDGRFYTPKQEVSQPQE